MGGAPLLVKSPREISTHHLPSPGDEQGEGSGVGVIEYEAVPSIDTTTPQLARYRVPYVLGEIRADPLRLRPQLRTIPDGGSADKCPRQRTRT